MKILKLKKKKLLVVETLTQSQLRNFVVHFEMRTLDAVFSFIHQTNRNNILLKQEHYVALLIKLILYITWLCAF